MFTLKLPETSAEHIKESNTDLSLYLNYNFINYGTSFIDFKRTSSLAGLELSSYHHIKTASPVELLCGTSSVDLSLYCLLAVSAPR